MMRKDRGSTHWFLIAIMLFLILLSISGCSSAGYQDLFRVDQTPPLTITPSLTQAGNNQFKSVPLPVGYGSTSPKLEVYFTDPLSPQAHFEEDGIETLLISAIDDAKVSLDVAIYSMNDYPIERALINAYRRGVSVRMVMESEGMDNTTVGRLLSAGIPIVGDDSAGLMHNKFLIVDSFDVWTGSANYTYNSFYTDNNNLIRIMDEQIAARYELEFEEMYIKRFFGPDTLVAASTEKANIDGLKIETYFSPDDEVVKQVVNLLKNAKKSIVFMVFSLTAEDYSEILIDKMNQGVVVKGIFDSQMLKSESSEFEILLGAGVPVMEDLTPGFMHHKVIIIDEEIVITGSYNFTANAEKQNDENILIIYNPDLAKIFLEEFNRVNK